MNNNPFADLIRLRTGVDETTGEFVALEIETGMLLCSIASHRPEGIHRRQVIENARKAFATAEKCIWKLDMQYPQLEQLAADLERLRFELAAADRGSSRQTT